MGRQALYGGCRLPAFCGDQHTYVWYASWGPERAGRLRTRNSDVTRVLYTQKTLANTTRCRTPLRHTNDRGQSSEKDQDEQIRMSWQRDS